MIELNNKLISECSLLKVWSILTMCPDLEFSNNELQCSVTKKKKNEKKKRYFEGHHLSVLSISCLGLINSMNRAIQDVFLKWFVARAWCNLPVSRLLKYLKLVHVSGESIYMRKDEPQTLGEVASCSYPIDSTRARWSIRKLVHSCLISYLQLLR